MILFHYFLHFFRRDFYQQILFGFGFGFGIGSLARQGAGIATERQLQADGPLIGVEMLIVAGTNLVAELAGLAFPMTRWLTVE